MIRNSFLVRHMPHSLEQKLLMLMVMEQQRKHLQEEPSLEPELVGEKYSADSHPSAGCTLQAYVYSSNLLAQCHLLCNIFEPPLDVESAHHPHTGGRGCLAIAEVNTVTSGKNAFRGSLGQIPETTIF